MHNKGQVVDNSGVAIDLKDPEISKWFNLIVEKTFIGSMIKPVFDIYNQCIGQLAIEAQEQVKEEENNDLDISIL